MESGSSQQSVEPVNAVRFESAVSGVRIQWSQQLVESAACGVRLELAVSRVSQQQSSQSSAVES